MTTSITLLSTKESVTLDYLHCGNLFKSLCKNNVFLFMMNQNQAPNTNNGHLGVMPSQVTLVVSFNLLCCLCFLQLGKHFFCDGSCPRGEF